MQLKKQIWGWYNGKYNKNNANRRWNRNIAVFDKRYVFILRKRRGGVQQLCAVRTSRACAVLLHSNSRADNAAFQSKKAKPIKQHSRRCYNRRFSLSKKHTAIIRLHKIELFSGNPLIGFPAPKQFTGLFWLPSWSLVSIRDFAVCGLRPRLCLWKPPPFEKGGRKLLFLCTFICEIGFSTN